jgi:hypothetical protein
MIALGITSTWLALTAAGFAALSALGRIELGEDLVTDRASREPREPREPRELALTETWPAMPGVSPL